LFGRVVPLKTNFYRAERLQRQFNCLRTSFATGNWLFGK